MASPTIDVQVLYDANSIRGTFLTPKSHDNAISERLLERALAFDDDYRLGSDTLDVTWTTALSLIRELAPLQRKQRFRFRPIGDAKEQVRRFLQGYRALLSLKRGAATQLDINDIEHRLRAAGFAKRGLQPLQKCDVARLLFLSNGANFSVPGAGKTTVTFALYLLLKQNGQHLLVVAPKNAFMAWQAVVRDCMQDAGGENAEPFTVPSIIALP
ncbi:MAG TPA: hypothetical protein VMT53_19915 [Terriglobales bacterium]|nr:hypothetical protein [Terriglobales bacterium]